MFDDEEAPAVHGAPPWVVTFADLMSLLLCFFVLLLSFSTMDVQRFRAIAESLQQAMGVPADTVSQALPVEPVPPMPVPEPTPAAVETVTLEQPESAPETAAEPPPPDLDSVALELAQREQQQTEALAQQLAEALHEEIVANRIELLAEGRTVTMRLRESGSFASGSDHLAAGAVQVLARIRAILAATPGRIEVAGHTDNQPIETERFRSNWELSSARAVSVAHELMRDGAIPPVRVAVSGHADTLPLAANEQERDRARNRRVEIIVRR